MEQRSSQYLYGLPKRLCSALLYSSVFISCCAFGLAAETYLLAQLPVSLPLCVFIFLSTFFTYNLSSVQSVLRNPRQPLSRQSSSWSQRHKHLLAMLGLASLLAAGYVYFTYKLKLNSWFLLHLALIAVGYTVPMVYNRREAKPLRSVPFLKVFLIAYVWAAATALLPLSDAGVALWEGQAIMLFLRRFVFILALALLFDIRDYSYDRHTNTLTLPGRIGISNTKLLSLVLLLVYALLVLSTEQGAVSWALLASALGAGLVVIFSAEEKSRMYYAALADGAMLLHAGLVYLATL